MATSTTARKRNATPVPEEAPPRRKRKPSKLKRLLRTLLLVLIIIAASVGVTLYYTWPAGAELLGLTLPSSDDTVKASEPEAPTPSPKPAPPSEKPIFSQLDPFTVTINDGGTRSRIMHVAITLQVADDASVVILNEYNPVVRDRVLKILSEQNASYVQTPEGREQLVDALIHALSEAYGRNTTDLRIENLLFTAFVIQ